ncbi:MAG TPA: BTAD domain-containing putative transcriptional regulator [Microlunatus sp.]|nr:BTAD domain-containing putative transcriptional regulator [Microlunatus sp.]
MPDSQAAAATLLRYRDLGSLVVERRDQVVPLAGRRLTAALSLLIMSVNQRVSADALVDALWGEAPPAGPEATLQSHLFRLRKLLEPDRSRSRPYETILHEAGGYRLVASPTKIDSLIFEEASGSARDLLLGDQPSRALNRCDEALGLWRGRPWTPHSDEPWAGAATARLEELHVQLRERRIDALLALGDPHQALADLDLLVAEHPLRERFWGQLMLACFRLGRTDEALAAYQRIRRLLDDEIGVEPGADLRELQARILDADPALLGPRQEPRVTLSPASPLPPAAAEIRLPPRRSPILGRDRELREVAEVLGTEHLLTLVGPAGVGKNRLIVEAARAAADRFPDGVWFVDLTAAPDGERLLDTVISGVGLEIGESGTALAALHAFMRNRRMLLVLGNGSHLSAALAELADDLLTDDVEASLAVTCREPLGVYGERVWNLGPLPLPPLPEPGLELDPDTLADQPAVGLFVQRATASGGVIDRDDLPLVAEICIAVDGLPLAIELAAAQVRSFSLTEIADQVRADSATLTRIGRGRSGPLTLADSIEQSVATLRAVDQDVHRAVAVLPGPFTATAAAAAAGLPVTTVRNALSGLVHRSLLVPLGPRDTGGASRFSQLAPIRSHGRTTASSQASQEAERRRDVWVTALAADMPRMGDPAEAAWYRRLDDDLAAVRATLQRCLVDEPTADGVFVTPRLGLYWYYRGMVVEWERWSTLAATSPAGQPFDRLLSGLTLACAISLAGRSHLAPPYVDAVDVYSEPMSRQQIIMLGEYLFGLSNTARATRDVVLGERVTAWLRRLADGTGDEILDLFAEIAVLATEASDTDPADLLPRVGAAHDRALQHRNDYAAWSVATLGALGCLRSGDAAEGLRWSDRTLGHYVNLGIGEAPGPLTLRGGLLVAAGDFFEAVKMLAAARAQARRGGQRWPRAAATGDLVELAESRLNPADRDRAYQLGGRLKLSDLSLPAFYPVS